MSFVHHQQSEQSVPAQGDANRQAEFVGLLGQHYRVLYAYAISLGADLHQADDVMQDASVVLWQQFDQFEAGTSFVRWGRVIVRNVFRNHRRSQWRRKYLFSPLLIEKLFETQCAAEELLEIRLIALRECLKKLPRADRQLVNAFYQKGSTLSDRARAAGKDPNILHKAVSRIRLRLSQCIDRKLGAERD
ncbi:MAG TPA: sigma-70 family RNA polymerase sigma factor [Planctomicrobium sp.]|nr:sigma-70 family RNA polymerase sigma factor [Planctomicrobium sp.]